MHANLDAEREKPLTSMVLLSPLLQQMQGIAEEVAVVGEDLAKHLHFDNFVELLHTSDTDAFIDATFTRKSLTHKRLVEFIRDDFHLPHVPVGARVCVCLPNIPELGTCLVSLLATKKIVFPLNPAMTELEMQWEIDHTRCEAVIVLATASSTSSILMAARALHLPVFSVRPSAETAGLFHISQLSSFGNCGSEHDDYLTHATAPVSSVPSSQVAAGAKRHPELALLLYTSGTSGRKKLVPYSLDMVVNGVACIISSWRLRSSDTCLNMMPLFHIGGIMRNLLSPLLSGGASVVCDGFDPVQFWDILEVLPFTWYYAAPTMHHALLQEAAARYTAEATPPTTSVRFLANAAGGLLPVLAKSLKKTFNATVLTSYGMTECMPISTPPIATYDLDPSGTSGVAVGPRVCIVTDDLEAAAETGAMLTALLPGEVGNIMVRGTPCFSGYEGAEDGGGGGEECFFAVDGLEGWFSTGDCGYLNPEGYLFITGRSKEIINRGGETISPYEIEEAIIQHPQVKDVLAFAAPHETLQETVGVVIVSAPSSPRLDLQTLCEFLEQQKLLHRSKWPSVVVFMAALPRNAANKLLRVKLAQRLSLEAVQEHGSSPLARLFDGECPKPGTALTVPIPVTSVQQTILTETVGIESFLLSIEGVTAAVVCVLDSPLRRDTIVAFVTPEHLDVNMIQRLCQENLHRYLCPLLVRACQTLDDIEVSGPGAVAALVTRIVQANSASSAEAPSTPVERQLEVIWRAELQLDPALAISKLTSFFALGGDSIRAGRLVGVIRKQMGVPLTVADLFSFPTIESFAGRVGALQALKQEHEDEGGDFHGNFLEELEIEKHMLSENDMSLLLAGQSGGGGASSRGGRGSPTDSSTSVSSDSKVRIRATCKSPEEEQGHVSSLASSSSSISSSGDLDPSAGSDQPDYEFRMKYDNTNVTALFTQMLPLAVYFPLRRLSMLFVIAWSWVFIMNRNVHRFPALLLAMATARLVRGLLFPLLGVACKWAIIGRYRPGRYPLFGAMYLKWWTVEQLLRILGRGFFGDESMPFFEGRLIRWYYIMMGAQIGKNVQIHSKAKLGQPDMLIIGDDVCIDEATVRPFALEEGHMILLPIVIGERCSLGVKSIVAPGAILASNSHIGPLSSSHEINDAHFNNRQYCRPTFPKPPTYLVVCLGMPLLLFVALVSALPWVLGIKLMLSDSKAHGWYDSDLKTLNDVFTWWMKPERLFYYFCLRIIQKVAVPPVQLAIIILIKWTVIGKFTPIETAAERAAPFTTFKYWLMSELLPGGDLSGVAKLIGTHYEWISVIYRALGAHVGKRVYWPGTGINIVEFDLLHIGDDVIFGSRSVFMPSSAVRACPITVEEGCMVADRCVLLPGCTMKRASVLGSGGLAREEFFAGVGSMWVGARGGTTTVVQPEDESFLLRDVKSPFGKAFYENGADYVVLPMWFIALYNTSWQAVCVCYRNAPLMMAMFIAYNGDGGDVVSFFHFFRKSIGIYFPLNLGMAFFSLTFDIAAKWVILGHREPGLHSWDRSSYCQRWQVYLTMQELRRGQLPRNGILDFISGSQYLVWYFRALGCSIGKDVCLFPNGGDPMMTEPDLVQIGQGSCIDDAYLIAHINTRGVFKLNRIVVGKYCVLKSNSRLLSGSSMEDYSILLEHTLVLSGEEVDRKGVRQGWPIVTHLSLEEHRMGLLKMLSIQDLDLTALFLSTNSVSMLQSMKRRESNKQKKKQQQQQQQQQQQRRQVAGSTYEMLSSDSSHHAEDEVDDAA